MHSQPRAFLQPTRAKIYQYQFNKPIICSFILTRGDPGILVGWGGGRGLFFPKAWGLGAALGLPLGPGQRLGGGAPGSSSEDAPVLCLSLPRKWG